MGLSSYDVKAYKIKLNNLINNLDERVDYVVNECGSDIEPEEIVTNAQRFVTFFLINEINIALELDCLNSIKRVSTRRDDYFRRKIGAHCGDAEHLNAFKHILANMQNNNLYKLFIAYANGIMYMDKADQLKNTIMLYRELRMNEQFSLNKKDIRRELQFNIEVNPHIWIRDERYEEIFDRMYYRIRDLLTALQEMNIIPNLNTRAPNRRIDSKIRCINPYRDKLKPNTIIGFNIVYMNAHGHEYDLNVITKKHGDWAEDLRGSYQSYQDYNKRYIEKYIENLYGNSRLKFE